MRRSASLLRKLLIGKCVGTFWCASARAAGVNFQACSIDHSDISPFRINHLRAVRNRIGQNLPSRIFDLRCPVVPTVYWDTHADEEAKLCQTVRSCAITYGDLVESWTQSERYAELQLIRARRHEVGPAER